MGWQKLHGEEKGEGEAGKKMRRSTPHLPLRYLTKTPFLGTRPLALEHRPKSIALAASVDLLPGTATVLRSRLAVAECEADEERLAHLLLAISHGLERLLLVVDFLVLGHIGFVGEVVEVAGVGLRVQLGDKGRTGLAQGGPVYFGKVVVVVDVLDVGEATAS